MRKLLGWLMLVIGVSGIALSISGFFFGRQLVDAMGQSLRTNLTLTIESLDTVRETLILTRSTVAQLDAGLETAQGTADNVSLALSETGPLLRDGSQVVTRDVPQSIETFQSSLPALIEVAGAVDSAMRTLSAFNVNRTILGLPLSFDLGVDYDPEIPFDQSVEELGATLEGMPQKLRDLEQTIDTTHNNLQTIGQDLSELGADLEAVQGNIDEAQPLIDDYITIVTGLADSARQSRLLLDRQMAQANLVLTVAMIWLALAQAAPLYLGWELVSGARWRSPAFGDEEIFVPAGAARGERAPGPATTSDGLEDDAGHD